VLGAVDPQRQVDQGRGCAIGQLRRHARTS
jgi:hypothetical protein